MNNDNNPKVKRSLFSRIEFLKNIKSKNTMTEIIKYKYSEMMEYFIILFL